MAYFLPFIAKIPENSAINLPFSNTQIREIKTLQFSTRQIAGIAPVEAFSAMLGSLLEGNQTIRLIREDSIEIQDGSLCKRYVLEHTPSYTRFSLSSIVYGKRKITLHPNNSIALSCKKEMLLQNIPYTESVLQALLSIFLFSDETELYLKKIVDVIQNVMGMETAFTVETPSGRKYTIKGGKRPFPKAASMAIYPLENVGKPLHSVCLYSANLQKRNLQNYLNIGEKEEQFLKHSTFSYWRQDLGLILEILGLRTPICMHLDEKGNQKYLKGTTVDNELFECSIEEDQLILQMHNIQYVYTVMYQEEATFLVLRQKNYYLRGKPSLCLQLEEWDAHTHTFSFFKVEHYGQIPYKFQKKQVSLEAVIEMEHTLLTENIEHWTLRRVVERFGTISW